MTFLLLPIFVVLWLSLHRWDLLGPIHYVGRQNWRSVLTDSTFGNSLLVTLVFVAIVVPATDRARAGRAALLARELPGSGVFRTLYVLPWICAPLAIAVLWRWILAPTDGAVAPCSDIDRMAHRSRTGAAGGFGGHRVDQRRLRRAVLPRRHPGHPRRVHAAARTDGATGWQRFWRITLPMLRPTMFFVLVTGVVSAAQVFDTVYALTGGGPEGRTDLVAHRIYAEAFGQQRSAARR